MRYSHCLSWTCCSRRKPCTGAIKSPIPCRSARFSASRPAPARRTAPIARKACASTRGLRPQELLELENVAARARAAREAGATRFCMGAAYRSPKPKDLRKVLAMIREVKALGLETCATLGMVTPAQALELKAAGLDFYNHNLDTSRRLLRENHQHPHLPGPARHAARPCAMPGMNVCCGGIVGMGEEPQDRVAAAAYSGDPARRTRKACPSISWCASPARRWQTRAGAGSLRFRAHHRRGAHPHAALPRAPLGGPQRHER